MKAHQPQRVQEQDDEGGKFTQGKQPLYITCAGTRAKTFAKFFISLRCSGRQRPPIHNSPICTRLKTFPGLRARHLSALSRAFFPLKTTRVSGEFEGVWDRGKAYQIPADHLVDFHRCNPSPLYPSQCQEPMPTAATSQLHFEAETSVLFIADTPSLDLSDAHLNFTLSPNDLPHLLFSCGISLCPNATTVTNRKCVLETQWECGRPTSHYLSRGR